MEAVNDIGDGFEDIFLKCRLFRLADVDEGMKDGFGFGQAGGVHWWGEKGRLSLHLTATQPILFPLENPIPTFLRPARRVWLRKVQFGASPSSPANYYLGSTEHSPITYEKPVRAQGPTPSGPGLADD
jgi:hypothetical protein